MGSFGGVGGQFWAFEASIPFGPAKKVIQSSFFLKKRFVLLSSLLLPISSQYFIPLLIPVFILVNKGPFSFSFFLPFIIALFLA